jgi:hypothetical protein
MCNSISEPKKHYATQKKPITKGPILHDSFYIKCKPDECIYRESKLVVAGLEGDRSGQCMLMG